MRDFIIWIGFGICQNEQSFFDQSVEVLDVLLTSQISSVCDTCFVSAFDRQTTKDYLQDLVNDAAPGTMRLTNLPRHLGTNKSRSQLYLFIHIHSNGELQIILCFSECLLLDQLFRS